MIWCLESIMIVCSWWSKPAEILTSSKTKPFFSNSQFFFSFFEIAQPICQLQFSFILCFVYPKHFYSFNFTFVPLLPLWPEPTFLPIEPFIPPLVKCLQSVKMAVCNILRPWHYAIKQNIYSAYLKECFPSILK